jgi:hypothetical protein
MRLKRLKKLFLVSTTVFIILQRTKMIREES